MEDLRNDLEGEDNSDSNDERKKIRVNNWVKWS